MNDDELAKQATAAIDRAQALAATAVTTEQILTALDAVTIIHQVARKLGDTVTILGHDLVDRALRGGIDEDWLTGRPFGITTVRTLARKAGRPRRKPGRAARTAQ